MRLVELARDVCDELDTLSEDIRGRGPSARETLQAASLSMCVAHGIELSCLKSVPIFMAAR